MEGALQNDVKIAHQLSTLTLHLKLGWAKVYYNSLPLFMHFPQCIIHPYTTYFSKIFKKMWVFYPHRILMLSSSILRNVLGLLDLYNPYGSVPDLHDFRVQNVHRMHMKSAFLLHLNYIPINNMSSIRYIFL
jgi:hypothetical protein